MKNLFVLVLLLFGFFACNEKENKTEDRSLDEVIDTNKNIPEKVKQATAKGNDGQTIAAWFPEKLMDYILDQETKEIGEGAQSWAKVTYLHPEDVQKNVTIEVWDGNGPAAMAVNAMMEMSHGEIGEEATSQMRRKVYQRKGRISSEREIYQNKQVNISFEVEGRFYTTLRSDHNTLEDLWQMADLLDFNALK